MLKLVYIGDDDCIVAELGLLSVEPVGKCREVLTAFPSTFEILLHLIHFFLIDKHPVCLYVREVFSW